MNETKTIDYQSGTRIGDTRVSSHIDCNHWTPGLSLKAWRHDGAWRIWRSDTGQLVETPELECVSWDGPPPKMVNRRITWSGNDFDLNPGGRSHTMRYRGTDMHQAQFWECYWDPNRTDENGILGTFVHELKYT